MRPHKFRFIRLTDLRGDEFLDISRPETRIDYGGHVLMDPNEMSNLIRGPAIDASSQVSVDLTKQFQRIRFV